jgi:hypothetical protein
MKYIVATFVAAALLGMSFTVSNTIEFTDFFKIAFEKSFDGLEKMKDQKTGAWEFEKAILDFDRCEIRFDLERGVHCLQFVRNAETRSTAEQFMNRFEQQVNAALPAGEYVRNQKESITGEKIVYDYSSADIAAKAKHPVVEFAVVEKKDKYEMVIKLYEPFNRQKQQTH